MSPIEIIAHYEATGAFSNDVLVEIRTDIQLRTELCQYFFEHKNRRLVVDLLTSFIELRKDLSNEISMDDLMLGCYLLGLHQNIEDCLLIWEAKNVDFDTFCGLDIQLMVFGGVEATIDYLESSSSEEAGQALEKVRDCNMAGDFDELDAYYDREALPWWV